MNALEQEAMFDISHESSSGGGDIKRLEETTTFLESSLKDFGHSGVFQENNNQPIDLGRNQTM
jgi:hypothetical protein